MGTGNKEQGTRTSRMGVLGEREMKGTRGKEDWGRGRRIGRQRD